MATQISANQFRDSWDAAIQALDNVRGNVGPDNYMGSGIDMRSVNDGGPWDLADAVTIPGIDPNSAMVVTFKNTVTGELITSIIYDEMLNPVNLEAFAPKIDGFMGGIYKRWLLLTAVQAAVAGVGAVPTDPDDYTAYRDLAKTLLAIHETGGAYICDEHPITWPNEV